MAAEGFIFLLNVFLYFSNFYRAITIYQLGYLDLIIHKPAPVRQTPELNTNTLVRK